jgi:hypothetical protein
MLTSNSVFLPSVLNAAGRNFLINLTSGLINGVVGEPYCSYLNVAFDLPLAERVWIKSKMVLTGIGIGSMPMEIPPLGPEYPNP